MTAKKTPFQMILFSLFTFFIVAAVLVFATLSAGGSKDKIGAVVIWGTLDKTVMEQFLSQVRNTTKGTQDISYKQLPADTFESVLNASIANGNGPDLILMNQASIAINTNKSLMIPFSVMSKREFKDTFVDEAQMFINDSGIRAMPFSIDPMVLYWNRDLFAEAGLTNPPKFWDEIFSMSERITKRDNANNINRATIAFGEFDNVKHAKDIISMLIMQAGGSITRINSEGKLQATLTSQSVGGIKSAERALRFYTDFSNPIKNIYTWNRSLPSSLNTFSEGKLALYLGYASEWKKIKIKNDNLNFDVATVPQIRPGASTRILTFGTLYGLAVLKSSRNVSGAARASLILTGETASGFYSEDSGVPSPRRSLLDNTPNNSLKTIFRTSALLSTAWYDPNTTATNKIFKQMIYNITSGSSRITYALQRANTELTLLLK